MLQGVTYTSYPPMSVMAPSSASFSFAESTFFSSYESGDFKFSCSADERELVEGQAVDPTLLNTFHAEEECAEVHREEDWHEA